MDSSQTLLISDVMLEEVMAHARACSPEEACGILAGLSDGNNRWIKKVFLMENSEHSPTFYVMDSREQFRVFDEMNVRGLEPVCIFHSHPHSPAWPSSTDLELAFYPDSLYMIISLATENPVCKVFNIVEGKVEEAQLLIEHSDGTENRVDD